MGWWFGRKSAPADARPFVPAWLHNDATEVGFARSYDAQFEEVFRRNPIGQRSVRLVAGMLGSLTIDPSTGSGQAPSTGSGQAALALIKRDGLLETVAANLLLHGNAYVQLIADHSDRPQELCSLRPERVQVVSDERGWPVAYLYRAAGHATRIERFDGLQRMQILHLKALHPRDDHYGMGCIEAACPAATVHNGARGDLLRHRNRFTPIHPASHFRHRQGGHRRDTGRPERFTHRESAWRTHLVALRRCNSRPGGAELDRSDPCHTATEWPHRELNLLLRGEFFGRQSGD